MVDITCADPCRSPQNPGTLPLPPDPPTGGGGGADVENKILCDIGPDGEVLGTALAVYEYDGDGNPVGAPTFVDPVTGAPYVAQGTLMPCDGGECSGPIQFCFKQTSTGDVEHPGRQYDITLPINPGFAVQSLQVDAVTHAANLVWDVADPDGEQFRQALTNFIDARIPSAAVVTITNPNAGQVICGTAQPMTIHIECLRLDSNPPNLIELIYNGGEDLILNPAYNETPPLNPPVAQGPYGFHLLGRQDNNVYPGNPPAARANCTNVANRGWETNDVGRTFEIWGQDQVAGQGVTPTPRGTPTQEITSDGPPPGGRSTIWQTFQAPANGMFKIRVVHGGRDAGEDHRITLSNGDVDDNQIGDLINDFQPNIPKVTTNGGTPANPWTQFSQDIPLNGGSTYTLALSSTNPAGGARGGLFTDMRAYIDRPDLRATATVDDDTCVVTTEETTTTTTCEYWQPRCVRGEIVSWKNVADGEELSNAAFWGQIPAPGCCLPETAAGEGGSVSAGNLIYNYEVCGVVGGIRQTLTRVLITDQSGGVIGGSFLGADGAPVTPAAGWTVGACPAVGRDVEVQEIIGCAGNIRYTRRTTLTYNNETGAFVAQLVQYFDDAGTLVTDQPTIDNWVPGDCAAEWTVTVEEGCANGIPINRKIRETVNNTNGGFTTLIYYIHADGTEDTLQPAGWTLGACPPAADQDTVILCDTDNDDAPVIVTVVYINGIPSSSFFNIDGTPFIGNPANLRNCAGGGADVPEIDEYSTTYVPMCFDNGGVVTDYFTCERVLFNNVTQLAVSRIRHWFNPLTGVDTTVQPAGVATDCNATAPVAQGVEFTQYSEPGCANNVPFTRVTRQAFDENGVAVGAPTVFYVASNGATTGVIPAGFTLGSCPAAQVRQYTSTVVTVTAATLTVPIVDSAGGRLIAWSVRHRNGTVTVDGSNLSTGVNAPPVTLDAGEVIDFDAGDDATGVLQDPVTIDATAGSARVTYQYRLP